MCFITLSLGLVHFTFSITSQLLDANFGKTCWKCQATSRTNTIFWNIHEVVFPNITFCLGLLPFRCQWNHRRIAVKLFYSSMIIRLFCQGLSWLEHIRVQTVIIQNIKNLAYPTPEPVNHRTVTGSPRVCFTLGFASCQYYLLVIFQLFALFSSLFEKSPCLSTNCLMWWRFLGFNGSLYSRFYILVETKWFDFHFGSQNRSKIVRI